MFEGLKGLLSGRVYEERPRGTYIDPAGRECPDPTPVAPPVNLSRNPSLQVMVQSLVRSELLRQHALQQRKLTFEEFDDMEIEDDPSDPSTPWENDYDPPVREMLSAIEERDRLAQAAATSVPGVQSGVDTVPPSPPPAQK